jgi:tRNA 2-thiouridine synthesizing protein E
MLNIERMMTDDPDGRLSALASWSEGIARNLAKEEGVLMTEEHWEVVRLLREHYRLHGHDMSGTRLLNALAEPFGARGGKKHLFELFPGGPVSQGCRIAGIPLPPYSNDPAFGSVE